MKKLLIVAIMALGVSSLASSNPVIPYAASLKYGCKVGDQFVVRETTVSLPTEKGQRGYALRNLDDAIRRGRLKAQMECEALGASEPKVFEIDEQVVFDNQ